MARLEVPAAMAFGQSGFQDVLGATSITQLSGAAGQTLVVRLRDAQRTSNPPTPSTRGLAGSPSIGPTSRDILTCRRAASSTITSP